MTTWMEGIHELTAGYSSENVWNMDDSGWFFKTLPDKGLVEKDKQAEGDKKSKERLTIAFFVNAAGEKFKRQLLYGRVECHVVSEDQGIHHDRPMYTTSPIQNHG